MKDFTIEELKTAVGCIMADMRGNWGWDYHERIYETVELLEALKIADKANEAKYQEDISLCNSEINGEYEDGRIFRDMANLYSYSSEEGSTQKVYDYLENILTYPESYQVKLN